MTTKTTEHNGQANLNALRRGTPPEPTTESLSKEVEEARAAMGEASATYDQLNKAIKVAADTLKVKRRDFQHASSRLQAHLRNAPGNLPAGRGQAR